MHATLLRAPPKLSLLLILGFETKFGIPLLGGKRLMPPFLQVMLFGMQKVVLSDMPRLLDPLLH